MVSGLAHFVMEKADGCQVCFNRAGRLAVFLHFHHIGSQVFSMNVGQLLQVVVIRKKSAEALHGLIIPLLGAEAALTVVAGHLVQLGDEGVVEARILVLFLQIGNTPLV